MVEHQTSLREHISELRSRLLLIVAIFFVWCGIGYVIRQPLTRLILQPLGKSVYYNSPQGGFEFFMRVIMTAGFIAVVPIVVYQLIRFVEPAVGKKLSSKTMRRALLWSLLLAVAGITFAYFTILPTSLEFFAKFSGNAVQPLISADSYLNFVLGILATFALLFQLPLIISIIDHIKPLDPTQLTRYRRHVIVGSLVIALILPFTYDPITQFVIALPIVVLYELSVILVRLNHRQTRAQKRERRIAAIVEAMHEANAPIELKAVEIQDTAEVQETPIVEPMVIEPSKPVIPEPTKTVRRVLVGPSKLSTKPHPQILDLRNAH